MRESEPSNLKRLHSARLKMARIVKFHGDNFWPIFQRIDREYQEELQKRNKLDDIIAEHGDTGRS